MTAVVFAAGDDLPAFKEAIEPFLVRGDSWPAMYRFNDPEVAARRFPEEVLDLLDRIAPAEPRGHRTGLDEVLDVIAEAAPALEHDLRMIRLRNPTLQ